MKLQEIYSQNLNISFEVFPVDDTAKLLNELNILKKYNPAFISLTCGAGGKDNKSFELVDKIQSKGFSLMPHFTCITSSKKDVLSGLKMLTERKIDNILALRGDIPENYDINKSDFKYAYELVKFIKSETDLSIGVAGYPEGHIENPDINSDIEFLKNKVEAGADAIFTQLFFENDKFYKFLDLARENSISVPIIPGIMPIISKKQIEKMTKLARITIPNELKNALDIYSDKSLVDFGIEYSTKQCEKLVNYGVRGLHFFTLNKSYSVSNILDNIRR